MKNGMDKGLRRLADSNRRDSPSASLDTECDIWQGAVNSKGYPQCAAGASGKNQLVHRKVYREQHGEIPAGHQIHHLCENKRCVNPAHLEAVSQWDHSRRHYPCSVDLVTAAVRAADGPVRLRDVADLADMHRGTLDVAAQKAVSAGLIERVSRGVYRVAA